MKNSKIIPDVAVDNSKVVRTVSADPGLLSNEELLEMLGDRRLTLKRIIAREKSKERSSVLPIGERILESARKRVRWFVDQAQLKISASDTSALGQKLVTLLVSSYTPC